MSDLEREALTLSLRVALWSVAAALPLATAVAWALARRRFWGHTLLNIVVHLPLVLPPVALGYVLLLALGRRGWIGGWIYDAFGLTIAFTWQGAAVASGVVAFPLMVRAIRLSFEAVDTRLEEAARSLGAGRLDAFVSVTLPLITPGLIAGAVLGFARAVGEFGATIAFVSNIPGETRTLPLALFQVMQTPGREDEAVRLMVILVAVAVIALALSEALARWAQGRIRAGAI